MPTEHPCDDGTHDCDMSTTYCAKVDSTDVAAGAVGYKCQCLEGFVTNAPEGVLFSSCVATANPTSSPTAVPTPAPTAAPTEAPTDTPTGTPTAGPTAVPTATPTNSPTARPTLAPTLAPTSVPTLAPTPSPTFPPVQYQSPEDAAPTQPDDDGVLSLSTFRYLRFTPLHSRASSTSTDGASGGSGSAATRLSVAEVQIFDDSTRAPISNLRVTTEAAQAPEQQLCEE